MNTVPMPSPGCARGRPPAGLLVALATAVLATALTTAVRAGQIPTGVFIKLHRGMSESELVLRAGEPDRVIDLGERLVELTRPLPRQRGPLGGGRDTVRYQSSVRVYEYHYVPDHTEHDPYLTIVTLRGGTIDQLRREKLLTRPSPPAQAPDDASPRRSDAERRTEQADAVLRAAEEYARIRERLKQAARDGAEASGREPGDGKTDTDADAGVDVDGDGVRRGQAAGDAADAGRTTLYRGTAPDGSTYFGDRPPPAGDAR